MAAPRAACHLVRERMDLLAPSTQAWGLLVRPGAVQAVRAWFRAPARLHRRAVPTAPSLLSCCLTSSLLSLSCHLPSTLFISCISSLQWWFLCSPGAHRQVDPPDFFVPHSIQAILLHLHHYWMQNPSRFLLNCAVHDWDLWSLLGQR